MRFLDLSAALIYLNNPTRALLAERKHFPLPAL